MNPPVRLLVAGLQTKQAPVCWLVDRLLRWLVDRLVRWLVDWLDSQEQLQLLGSSVNDLLGCSCVGGHTVDDSYFKDRRVGLLFLC